MVLRNRHSLSTKLDSLALLSAPFLLRPLTGLLGLGLLCEDCPDDFSGDVPPDFNYHRASRSDRVISQLGGMTMELIASFANGPNLL